MIERKNPEKIFGCFIATSTNSKTDEEFKIAQNEGDILERYIWSLNSLDSHISKLKNYNYGKDFDLILLEFYIKPIDILMSSRRLIGTYRKKEKSIGLVFNIMDDFFAMTHTARVEYIKSIVITRLKELSIKVKKNKLDLDIDKLIIDTEKVMKEMK